MRAAWPLLAATLVSSAACSFTALDGFSDGAGSSADGGASASSSSSSSASSSSGGGSTSTSSTSSSSGGGAADGGEPCAFCTDFEDTTLQQLGAVAEDPPGKLELSSGALRARLPANSDGGKYQVAIRRDVSDTARRATLEVDVQVDDEQPWTGLGGNTVLLAVGVESATKGAWFELYLSGTSSFVTTNNAGSLSYDDTASRIALERFVRVRLECDFTAGAGSFRMYFDGQLVASRSGVAFPALADAKTRVFLGLARNNSPTPELDVRYDNLAVTLP